MFKTASLAPFLLAGLFAPAFLFNPAANAEDSAACEALLAKLPAGTSVIGQGLEAIKLTGPSSSSSIVDVEGMPFKQAVRVETVARPKNVYDIHLISSNVETMSEGDAFLMVFYARSLSEGGRLEALFEKSSPEWTKFIHQPISLDSTWKKCFLPFTIRKKWDTKETSYAPGKAHMAFNLGFNPQTVEIGGISCVKYPKSVSLDDLPSNFLGYEGMEPDAPWRKDAAARIESLRKGDFSVEVVDASGNPLKDASVKVSMKHHAFLFGTAVAAGKLWTSDGSPDTDRYKQEIKSLFNFAVIENNLKWDNWDNKSARPTTENMLSWFAANNIPVRGHNLVWPSWRFSPKSLKSLANDPAALRKAIVDHVRDEATACRGKVVDFDVMNEPFSNHDVMDVCGDEVMVEWFKTARECDPSVKLFINDFDILANCDGGDSLTEHQKHYLKTIKFLLDNGAPLDGIGMQGHFGMSPTPPVKMLKMLDLFAQFGKEIEVTEYDNEFYNDGLSAKFTRDLMTVLFSHPSVHAFLMWGFWDGAHWLNSSPIYNKDWTLKPSGQAYKDLVFKEWWTNLDGKTDASGSFKGRGFLGDYEAVVEAGGLSTKASFSVDKSSPRLKLVLK